MMMKALRALAAAVALFCLPANALAQDAPLRTEQIDPDFQLVQISADVYAFVSNNTTHDWEDGNTTVIVTNEGVVVVGASTSYLSRRHLARIQRLTRQPVRYLIVTHWHRDHNMGASVYQDAFPDLQVIEQSRSAEISDRRNPAIIAQFMHGQPGRDLIEQFRGPADTGRDAEGNQLAGYDLMRARRGYAEMRAVIEGGRETRYVSPQIRFDEGMVLHLGGKEIQLRRVVGHTDGDTLVYLPQDQVLITGDVVTLPTPFGGGEYEQLIDALDGVIASPARIIVPGHGPVQYDRTQIQLQRDMYRSLVDQAIAAARERLTPDQFKERLDLESFRTRIVGDDPEKQWGWDNYFLAEAVERVYDRVRAVGN
jgi:glyoxylase-like metal-dependent hydrolase (beta-lactamase superfamily II)